MSRATSDFIPAQIVQKKRNNEILSEQEIQFMVDGFVHGSVGEGSFAALLMAIFFRGLNPDETLSLTKAMLNSGETIRWDNPKVFHVDKHSTGGIGDKTSMILAPIVASLGVKVPMMAGRGLGHTGGTLDKLESIPGFNTQLNLNQFKSQIEKIGVAIIGQTPQICPADKKIYALRDVTATIESIPLITASILSKKFAEGADGLVLDLKVGSGAFMKELSQARELADSMMRVCHLFHKKITVLLTDMNQPMGRYAGNCLEITECIDVLKNSVTAPADVRSLSLDLSAEMLLLAGFGDFKTSRAAAEKAIVSGQAYEKFAQLCAAQGGKLDKLPTPKPRAFFKAKTDGFMNYLNTESLGWVGVAIGAGRKINTEPVDFQAGLEFHKRQGDPVKKGDILYSIFSKSDELSEVALQRLEQCTEISLQTPTFSSLILERKSASDQ